MITGTPSELNDLLAAGQLDVSVVSAVEYARNAKDYFLLPDLAISCDGPIRSVALFSRRPIEQLNDCTILVSASSRTSVHLLELLLHDHYDVVPKLVEARAESADLRGLQHLPHDGVLVIGDAALLLATQNTYPYRYDLGAEWHEWTGLPFVFAVWAGRRECDRTAAALVHQALIAGRDWGLAHLPELALDAAQMTGLPQDVCLEYLSGIDYALTYKHLEGLTSFFRRLAVRGTVAEGALTFLSVA